MKSYLIKPSRRGQRSGFTLVELLVVIAIIVSLAGLIAAGVGVALRKSRATETKTMATQLVTGVENFYADHNYLPIRQGSGGGGDINGNTADGIGVAMLTALTNREAGAGTGAGANIMNKKGVDYFNWKMVNSPTSGLFFNGNLLQGLFDPYGSPLQFRIDGDYNNRILDPTGFGPQVAARIIVWSFGPDGIGGNQNDWIYSWKD